MHNSDAMRYVGGGLLNKSLTRASQRGQGGLRIEPGGREASFIRLPVSLFSAKRWHGSDGLDIKA